MNPAWKTGHVLGPYDPDEPAYKDHPELSGAASIATDDVDLRPEMPPVRLQIAQDCVGHGVSTLAWVLARSLGVSLPFDDVPSVLHLYAGAQLVLRPRQPLVDEGSVLSCMFRAGAEDGLVAEKDWPEIPENVNVVPPDDIWRKAERVVITGARRLSDGANSIPEMKAALRRRRPTTICMRVDERFAEIGPEIYMGPGGRVIGSHCMVACGYVSIIRSFIVRNSWGTDFGDLGYALVHEDVVARLSYEKYTFDLARILKR